MPILDLNTFKENLGNVVRPNRFIVQIEPPTAIRESLGIMNPLSMVVHAQSATIPDRAFNEVSVKYYGMELKVPASETIQDLSITFTNNESWKIRDFFEIWANLINNRSNSHKGYMDELFEGTYITVTQMNFVGDVIAKYKYKHAFPKSVDQIELSMETSDTVETFTVTFGYSYWERVYDGT